MASIYSALKLKPGEIEALRESERFVTDSVVPIFDVARPSSKTSIERRLASSLDLIHRAWPRQSREFYLDLHDLPLELRLANNEPCLSGCHTHPLDVVIRDFAA